MNLILTHEQADFDALAALYGASLLNGGLPVLPRRINRNGRAFLTLYGAELPFVEPRDLPQESVARVTLVDTQSLITLRGMGRHTAVRVIDHHPRRPSTPPEWDVTILDTGATTTYFVEALQEHAEPLSVVQSTLLLLGIYEDTGSLTYSRTTPRDVRAAAWLLEQGASLRMAAEYLNPPLSPDQREAYDLLVRNAETFDIHGQRVVLACGQVTSLTEEISTLAHKLRDLFDPAALFVLVQTVEGVRLVARSTTDQIDVAAIAAHFGGGGHDRAAAALIKTSPTAERDTELTLDSVRQTLLDILPRHVRPSISVAQLMSRRPRTLPPETPVAEAAKLMTRYGYEGFPVVRDGRVIGLLTRRAVDRALSHRLNLPAASLMDAGEVSVRPEDSLQHLQTVMTESGWGQVPVTDDAGKVIGIVTRTDLLKTLAPRPTRHARRHLTDRLQQSLPPAALALIRSVAEAAAELHLPAYIVGGFVRDLLLGRPSTDFDIVVEGDAIALARALSARHGGRVTSHARFGTAKWHLQDAAPGLPAFLDLISARQEYYESPTALPTVERGSIKLDLHRRDFTINTLAMRLDGRHFGELHDYYGGQRDLERRLVRVLHSLSFIDDPTRMLRAVRYEQRYGFTIESRTRQLMDEAAPLLSRLTHERLRHELDLILEEDRAAAMLQRLADLGLLSHIHAALPADQPTLTLLADKLNLPPAPVWSLRDLPGGFPLRRALGYALWLLPCTPEQIAALDARLRFPVALDKILYAAVRLRADLPALDGASPSAWVARLEDAPLLSIYVNWLASGQTALEQYAAVWRHIQPKTDGHALRALGLAPGPVYQRILAALRAAWLNGDITSEAQEHALLQQLMDAQSST
ncbi:MAG: CBS domain-containing protein [Anaerolineales bacterium]